MKLGTTLWSPEPSGANGVTDRAATNAGTVFLLPRDFVFHNLGFLTDAMNPEDCFWTPDRVEQMA